MNRNTSRGALCALFLTGAALAATARGSGGTVVSQAIDGWDYGMSGAALSTLCEHTLARGREAFAAIERDTRPATLATVFGAYDAMRLEMQAVNHVWYMTSVHPDAAFRAASEQCMQEVTDFIDTHNLSPGFYRRVAAIDLRDAAPAERLMVANRLREFRKSGVDRDAQTRAQVRELKRQITELGNTYERNVREDTRYVETTAAELTGLPQDFLEQHPADEAGIVRLSTDYPDLFPVLQYAKSDTLRRRLYLASNNIGTPANTATLGELLARRHELATLLGYASYAELAMDGLMIGSPANAHEFLDEVGAALAAPAARDMDKLLQRLRRIDPAAGRVQAWQSSFLSNLVRMEQYELDAREVREYFDVEKVRAGIFRLTEDLFGVEIVPWETPVWHRDVTAWELREGGRPLGRFYLDLHPRENKFKHAAHWTLRPGLRDRQLPLSGLATNFPEGLMEHDEVETFLHEFGHLLHNMFSGTQQWLDITGMSMERDFVEAPSQMLEEWVWDYDTLRRFATNAAGEAIPAPLVQRMVRARYFGQAAATAQQIFYANVSLNFYDRDPDGFQLAPLTRELQGRYSPYPWVEGTYMYNNFGHLTDYASNYYTYQWSLAIATDLFTRFDEAGLRSTEVAAAYRREVLGAAGGRPAHDFVAAFLGRPFSTAAYIELLGNLP